jgi:hypothetical protein
MALQPTLKRTINPAMNTIENNLKVFMSADLRGSYPKLII